MCPADPDSLRTLGPALAASALGEDPFYVWLEPDAVRRQRLLRSLMRYALGGCAVEGVLDSGGSLVGLIATHDPRRERLGGGGIPWRALSLAGRARAWRALGLYRALRAARPREAHVHVEVLAVAASARGQGWARRLLMPALESADARGWVVHLETTQERNVALYARFGFEVTRRIEGPFPTSFVMQRVARIRGRTEDLIR